MKEFLAFYRLLPRARRRQFLFTLVLMLAGAACEMVTIGAVLPFLALIAAPDAGIVSPQVTAWLARLGGSAMTGAALLLVAAALVAAGVRLLLIWATQKFAMLAGSDLAAAVFARNLHLPYAEQIRRNSSRTLTDVTEVQRVVNGVLLPAIQGVTAAFIALFITGLLFLIHAYAAAIGAAVIGLSYLILTFVTGPALRRNAADMSQSADQRMRIVQEALGGIRDVMLDRSQRAVEARFKAADGRYRRAQAVNAFLANSARFPIEAAGLSALAVVALVMFTDSGGIVAAIPVLGALGLGAQRLLPLVQQTYGGWSQATGNFHAFRSVMETLETPVPQQPAPSHPEEILDFARLELVQVGFRHADGAFALKNVSLDLPKGGHLGIAGPSGSGKSTLLDLIIGLLSPDEGEILVNGQRLDADLLTRWQAALAHVPQTIFLTDDTIAANIAFPRQAAELDPGQLERAVKAAALEPFLAMLSDGLMTQVGERGVRLSAGQRQRIGVARALVRSPSVLILDEATSALDEATEAHILAALAELPDLTIITVAHRASALSRCRSWVHLHDGRAVTTPRPAPPESRREGAADRSRAAGLADPAQTDDR